MAALSKMTVQNIETIPIDWIRYFADTKCLDKLKLNQLKSVAKYNSIRVSGTKTELNARITKHFDTVKASVFIQSIVRRNQLMCQMKMRGPGLKNRAICVNDTDFYTMDPISDIHYSDFFSYADANNFVYGFDLNSLSMMLQKQKVLTNPYNRCDLDYSTGEKIIRLLGKERTPNQEIKHSIMFLTRSKPDDVRIRELFYTIDHLGNYTQESWFTNLTHSKLKHFIMNLYEIWTFRANITAETKRMICPYFYPFRDGLEGRVSAHGVNPDVLDDFEELRQVCLTVMENIIYTGINDDFKRIGAMHVLTALTHTSPDARNAIPWLYESII